jgi:hypothetical protein
MLFSQLGRLVNWVVELIGLIVIHIVGSTALDKFLHGIAAVDHKAAPEARDDRIHTLG